MKDLSLAPPEKAGEAIHFDVVVARASGLICWAPPFLTLFFFFALSRVLFSVSHPPLLLCDLWIFFFSSSPAIILPLTVVLSTRPSHSRVVSFVPAYHTPNHTPPRRGGDGPSNRVFISSRGTEERRETHTSVNEEGLVAAEEEE